MIAATSATVRKRTSDRLDIGRSRHASWSPASPPVTRDTHVHYGEYRDMRELGYHPFGVAPSGSGTSAGSVTSARIAPRAGTAASASTSTATPCAPPPRVTARPAIRSSATTGHARMDPNGVMV